MSARERAAARPGTGRAHAQRAGDRGQATVEVAWLLPLLVLIVAVVAWVAQIGREQVALTDGVRAAAREASVGADAEVARAALEEVSDLDPARLTMTVETLDDVVRVTARYRSPARIPLLGATVAERELTAEAFFLKEPPP